MSDHQATVDKEVEQLKKDIVRLGALNSDGKYEVPFGVLFDDEQTQQYYEAIVGTIKAGKKKGVIGADGMIWLKGAHDKVPIKLLETPADAYQAPSPVPPAAPPTGATLQAFINENPVVIFVKDDCPYCQTVKELFQKLGVDPTYCDDKALKVEAFKVSGTPTVPQVFIGGKLLGNSEITAASNESGALFGLLSAAGVEADGAKARLNEEQMFVARQAMVPDPYIEDSLAERGFFAEIKDGELPHAFPNLYAFDASTGQFTLEYTEKNKAYAQRPDDKGLRVRDQEAEPGTRTQTLELQLPVGGALSFKLQMNQEVTEKWGIKFIASVDAERSNGTKNTIYMPGVLTFDPAGITGDSHSSERIGPSCARVQTSISIAQLFVLQHGGTQADADSIQDASDSMIHSYNGRLCQWKWMRQQIREACVEEAAEVTPFPQYIQSLVDSGEVDLSWPNRTGTREYLESYAKGKPIPPMSYFLKVNEKGCSCFEKL
jgi:glutaredoxin